MRTKSERLAILIRKFIKQVDKDLHFKIQLYSQYDEERKKDAVTRFEHEAWLLCQSSNEMHAKKNAHRQLQKPNFDKLDRKLNDSAFPFFERWKKETLLNSKSIQEEHLYEFWCYENISIRMLLKNLKDVIDSSHNRIEIKAAQLCRESIIEYLANEVGKKFCGSGRKLCPLTDILSIGEKDIQPTNESCYGFITESI